MAFDQKGNAGTVPSQSSVQCFCPPILKIKKIMYIKRAWGDVMWKINENAPGQINQCEVLAPRDWTVVFPI